MRRTETERPERSSWHEGLENRKVLLSWMGVQTDLKVRGVQDILINLYRTDLNGLTDTIRTVFPQSSTQTCVVHQIRNSCRYVVFKDEERFTADIEEYLKIKKLQPQSLNLEKKWGGKLLYAILTFVTVFFLESEN